MMNIAVFASGTGSNFLKIIEAVEQGQIKANIKVLITDRLDINALFIAKEHNITSEIIIRKEYSTLDIYTRRLEEVLEYYNIDFIVLAGYLKKIPAKIVDKYPKRIINIHPSLIPKHCGKSFYGDRVFRSILESGDKESGVTIHYVDEEYDHGEIIMQKRFQIDENETLDSLREKTRVVEHGMLPSIIGMLIMIEYDVYHKDLTN